MDSVMERYEALKEKVIERRVAFNNLMAFIETETAWLTAPASTRFHLSEEQGLLEHSCNVAETMLKIKDTIAPHIADESCVIVALLHDLGKVGMLGNPQYLKSDGKYPFAFNKELVYLSVPIRSIYLTLPYIELSEEEVQAIVYHDGQYVDDNASVARREEPLTLLLQYADTWSGFVLEKKQQLNFAYVRRE
jgi:hypothetical protein